jgi:hypothetical protein
MGTPRWQAALSQFTALQWLLLTTPLWLSTSWLVPAAVQAYEARVDVTLDRLADETYQSFLRRAELVTQAAAQRSFDRDVLINQVSVMIIGQHQGNEAPLLLLQVSRDEWTQQPDPRRWAIYYRSAKTLLGLPSGSDAAIPATPGAVRWLEAAPRSAVPPKSPISAPFTR